ncbi:putative proteinD(P)-BINDING ROSSMANN-FOLD SUPERFAMILY PROTEIN [Salix viminalis]|uniref:Gfo/Idh/MocA-like oxidoreductase C-terminal domain-containing protein n=1 Tax=Salix viminalis TaxID=40686 RepID=A0A9Q0P9Z0_SALVM|nr:putative proteinD(P)-BINDING ROSSMANN-FOLD SUPERFAMILY PROTEIN [Salix viminalis]
MPPEFFENNIRVKQDMDALGVLGDLGWYCVGAVLWAKNYELPNVVSALPAGVTRNSAGIVLSCTACLNYDQDHKTTGWNAETEKVVVDNQIPQEAFMVQELARLAQGIKKCEFRPDNRWPEISRKTQIVVDAIKKSIDLDCKPVYL